MLFKKCECDVWCISCYIYGPSLSHEIWPCPGNMATLLSTAKFFWPIGDCINDQVPLYVDLGESMLSIEDDNTLAI